MEISSSESQILHSSATKINTLIQHMESVIKGKREQIVQVITCLLAKGHILMEDNPGTGKTVYTF